MRALTYLVAIFLKQLVEEKHKSRAFVVLAFYRDIYQLQDGKNPNRPAARPPDEKFRPGSNVREGYFSA
jgi:hypothetical protein